MDEVHGKEIDLQKTTIKIPGANKPRIGKSFINLEANKLQSEINSLNLNSTSYIINNNLCTQNTVQITASDFKSNNFDDIANSASGLFSFMPCYLCFNIQNFCAGKVKNLFHRQKTSY